MSLEDADILELTDRYNYLIQQYAKLSIELADKLEKFGKYKKELETLTVEFGRRGASVEDPEPLKKLVEQEISKRGYDNVETQTDDESAEQSQ